MKSGRSWSRQLGRLVANSSLSVSASSALTRKLAKVPQFPRTAERDFGGHWERVCVARISESLYFLASERMVGKSTPWIKFCTSSA